jgi:hypothetical protein
MTNDEAEICDDQFGWRHELFAVRVYAPEIMIDFADK